MNKIPASEGGGEAHTDLFGRSLAEGQVERGRGRPAGALNRKTLMLPAWLEELGYRDPAVILSEIASMPQADLARLTRTKPLQAAMAARIKAASELMPYLHGKRVPVSDQGEERLPMLILDAGTNMIELRRQAALAIDARPVENQGVRRATPEAEASHAASDEPKPLI